MGQIGRRTSSSGAKEIVVAPTLRKIVLEITDCDLKLSETSGRRSHGRDQLHDHPISPAILASRLFLNGAMQFSSVLWRDEARSRGKFLSRHSHLRARIGAQVPYPVGSRVFRDHVKATVAVGKPDFDFPWLATPVSASRQIEKTLAPQRVLPLIVRRRRSLAFEFELGLVLVNEFAQLIRRL